MVEIAISGPFPFPAEEMEMVLEMEMEMVEMEMDFLMGHNRGQKSSPNYYKVVFGILSSS